MTLLAEKLLGQIDLNPVLFAMTSFAFQVVPLLLSSSNILSPPSSSSHTTLLHSPTPTLQPTQHAHRRTRQWHHRSLNSLLPLPPSKPHLILVIVILFITTPTPTSTKLASTRNPPRRPFPFPLPLHSVRPRRRFPRQRLVRSSRRTSRRLLLRLTSKTRRGVWREGEVGLVRDRRVEFG